MDVAITGSHGLIGQELVRSLRSDGHTIRRIVRSHGARTNAEADGATVAYDPAAGVIDHRALDGVDAVVNLAGEPIAKRAFTAKHRRTIVDSRVGITTALTAAIGQLDHTPRVLVSGSAIGIYGAHRGDEVLTEASALGGDFLAELCLAWESAARPAEAAGVRVALARTSVVLAARGGALGAQLPLFKVGLGGPAGDGRQWLGWISLDDQVAALRHLIDREIEGPVNLAAPNPVTNAEFATTLGRVLHRPARVRVPARLLTKGPKPIAELVDNLLLASQRVTPGVLSADGFAFADPDLEPTLRRLLGRATA
ncbi:MAG TPA: TIGR01777 family oxidoreductase [Acidimicrobiales bacterium]|jgi:uncharacterized protein (TIGR01777 family)|nr:TIGR01777 family oxidoreductase [Acidimicrobiales bacterium]